MKFYLLLRSLFIFCFILISTYTSSAQLTYADSVFFYSVFTQSKYANDSVFPGSWYVNEPIQSVSSFFNTLDSSFKFSLSDLNNQNTFIVDDMLTFDSTRNTTFNLYPIIFNQPDPLVSLEFALNGKAGKTYSYFYPTLNTQQTCKTAFFVLPGNGENVSTNIVQGIGYHNQNCSIVNNLMTIGDVYTYIKPNQDTRAIHWNNLRLNEYLYFYLNINHKNYGINYLTEIIATIKYLKSHYSKVVLLGCSEGGYAGLLASMFAEPDAAIISAGYTIGFDTSVYSKDILRDRFDSLVDKSTMNVVKQSIDSLQTHYLFTYGNFDYLTLMQLEHDSLYTEQFLNDTLKCNYYYNYSFHSFPDCAIIDSFEQSIESRSLVHFTVSDTSSVDSTIALVSSCGKQLINIGIFKDTALYHTISNPVYQNYVTLKDSGMYYVKQIIATDSSVAYCTDSIYFAPPPIIVAPNAVANYSINDVELSYTNPIQHELVIKTTGNPILTQYTLYDIMGNEQLNVESIKSEIRLNTSQLQSGIYFLRINRNQQLKSHKVLKL